MLQIQKFTENISKNMMKEINHNLALKKVKIFFFIFNKFHKY